MMCSSTQYQCPLVESPCTVRGVQSSLRLQLQEMAPEAGRYEISEVVRVKWAFVMSCTP